MELVWRFVRARHLRNGNVSVTFEATLPAGNADRATVRETLRMTQAEYDRIACPSDAEKAAG